MLTTRPDEMVEAGIDECLDYYDPENRTFPQIASRVSVGGELTKQEVLQILKWKLRSLKDLNAVTISDKYMAKINEAITKARKENGKFSALELLDCIPGIGLAAGTAPLSVCYPEKFTTMAKERRSV